MLGEGLAFWIAGGIAAALVGMGKGGLPLIGMLGVPVLALVISPVTAAGLLLPVYVVSDMIALWAYRRAFNRRVVAILAGGAVFGIALGWATATIVPVAAVTLLIGLIGLVFAAQSILRPQVEGPPREAELGKGLFWGAVTGFTSFVSHSGAPPYQVYTLPLRMEKAVFAGTSTITFAIINAVKLLPYWAMGELASDNLHKAAILFLPAVLAVFGGVKLVKVLPERLFFRLVIWALLLISAKLVYDGVRGLIA